MHKSGETAPAIAIGVNRLPTISDDDDDDSNDCIEREDPKGSNTTTFAGKHNQVAAMSASKTTQSKQIQSVKLVP